MKKVRVRSIEEFRSLPEGEWVEVIGPMKWEVPGIAGDVRVEKGALVIRLPRRVRKSFKAKPGDALEARLSGESLVVTRGPRKRARRAS